MQRDSQEGLSFLRTDEKMEDSPWNLATIRASHAETVLELQKTRQLLLLEHRISQDLQVGKRTRTQHKSVHSSVEKRTYVEMACLHSFVYAWGITAAHAKLVSGD